MRLIFTDVQTEAQSSKTLGKPYSPAVQGPDLEPGLPSLFPRAHLLCFRGWDGEQGKEHPSRSQANQHCL